MKKEKYKVVFNDGTKPYEKEYKNLKDLKTGLFDFLKRMKESEYGGYYDAHVYVGEKDITESQEINELIAEIIE